MSEDQQPIKRRRPKLTEQDVDRMKQLEAEGKTRKQIAVDRNCDPACVTRKLGAVRPYRGVRAMPLLVEIEVEEAGAGACVSRSKGEDRGLNGDR